ncbi:MAG: hypothetical protein IH600_03145 [Bacteroidetes bacterium]|nr:hypothetical protein [Bacteroidota bacterium]
MIRFILITMLLLNSSLLHAQEFAVVGDWANRDACVDWWGFPPTDDQWALIDALNCNWLKIALNEHGTRTEDVAILGYNGLTVLVNSPRFIVDRIGFIAPETYAECTRSPQRSSAIANFLARYVVSSLAIRLQPESDFDYNIMNPAHGELVVLGGAETTPYLQNPPPESVVRSEIGEETIGVVAADAADNYRPGGSQLLTARVEDFNHLVVRARLVTPLPDPPPSPPLRVYTVNIRYWDGVDWQVLHSEEIRTDHFVAPGTDLQELTFPLPPLSPVGVPHPTRKDISIEWHEEWSADIDWVEISSQCSFDVLHETDPAVVENRIRASIDWYNDPDPAFGAVRANIGKLFTADEIIWPELLNARRINSLIHDQLSGAVPGYSYYLDDDQSSHRWGYYSLSGIDEMSVTGFMFADGTLDDGMDTQPFADMNNATEAWSRLAETVQQGMITGKVFWPNIQTNEQGAWRFPYPEEAKAAVGLGLCYGAKGIVYNIVWGQIACDYYIGLLGPTSLACQAYRDITRDTVSVMNLRLRGILGDQFMNLNWDRTFDGGFADPLELTALTLQNTGNAVCSALSTHLPGAGFDAVAYVQIADYYDAAGHDYLFLVNKRTRPLQPLQGARIVNLTFTNGESLFFQDVESHAIEVIPVNGTLETELPAGEFCLLRADGDVLTAPLTVDNVMYVRAGAQYTIASTLTVTAGAVIHVEAGATLTVGPGGTILLDGGSIVLHGGTLAGGVIRIMNPQGLQGIGNITAPNLCFGGEWFIPDGTDITLEDGGLISFACAAPGSENRIIVYGALRFRGAGVFTIEGDLLEANVGGMGTLDINGTMTIAGLPTVNNWDNGRIVINGVDEMQRCMLIMRDRAEINSASRLEMEYVTLTSDDAGEWDGIQSIGPGALCVLRYVDILRVYCDPVTQGAGVYFFEAPNAGNLVSHCNILRVDKSDKLGDGIFLQPGYGGMASYVQIECTTVSDDWWTGLTNVSSKADITGLTAIGNLRGMGIHLAGALVDIVQSTLDSHAFEGVFAQSGILYLGEFEAGYNQICNNNDEQIELTQMSRLYSNGSMHGINNDIGHLSPFVTRIKTDPTSTAEVQNNYWLVPAPLPAMFDEDVPGSIIWNPYLTQSARPGFHEWTCGEVFLKRRLSPISSSPTRGTLKNFAEAGRMNEVYSFISGAFSAAATGTDRLSALHDLLVMELLHMRSYPDSTAASTARFMQYLTNRRSMLAVQQAPDLLAMQAVFFTFAGYADSAYVAFSQLEQYYPTSVAYRNSMQARLMRGFITRDSIAIDDAINAMQAATIDTAVVRLARSERRAYYRCLQSGMMPKRTRHQTVSTSDEMSITMDVHPNPLSTEAVLMTTLPEAMHVRIRLLTIDGRLLRVLHDGFASEGQLTVPVSAAGLTPGTYLCTLESERWHGLTRFIVVQ